MKRAFILSGGLCFIVNLCFGQHLVSDGKRNSELAKWMKSVVNIECRGSKYAWFQILDSALKRGINSDPEKFTRFADSMTNIINVSSGTALYVSDGSKRYLLTAKHVVYDEASTLQNAFNQRDTSYSNRYLHEAIYEFGIKTPYDTYLSGKRCDKSGWTSSINNKVYVLSSNQEDIAVISLQAIGLERIRKAIDSAKYIPMPIGKIDTNAKMEIGDDIYSIGYPVLSKVAQYPKQEDDPSGFQSRDVVLPIFVFGKISMWHPHLPYFIADVDGYPGNSGGPLIRENKLIGVVSGQILLPVVDRSGKNSRTTENLYSRGNLMQITMPTRVIHYVRKLQEKEADQKNFY